MISPTVSRSQRLWRALKPLMVIVLAAVMIALLGVVLLITLGPDAVDRFQARLDRLAFVLFVLRVTIYSVILYYWQPITRWVAQRKQWSEATLTYALAHRRQMAFYFVLLEVMITGTTLVRMLS